MGRAIESIIMFLNIGTPKIIDFPFVPNGKFIILGVPEGTIQYIF